MLLRREIFTGIILLLIVKLIITWVSLLPGYHLAKVFLLNADRYHFDSYYNLRLHFYWLLLFYMNLVQQSFIKIKFEILRFPYPAATWRRFVLQGICPLLFPSSSPSCRSPPLV